MEVGSQGRKHGRLELRPSPTIPGDSKLTIITAGVKTLAGLFTREPIRGLAAEKEEASVLPGGFAAQTFEALLHP